MSFSRKVKQELEAVTEETAIHCKMAQLAAMIACTGEPDVDVLRITSDNNIVIDVIAKLLKELFDIEVINKSPMMIPEDDFIRIGEGLRMTADIQDVYLTLIKSSCCKKAFLRGAFLCNGSVNTPEGAYHFEISSVSEKFAGVIKDIIFVFGIDAKLMERKGHYVVYLKDSSEIADVLNILGAPVSQMEFYNAMILKSVRNDINRKVNCETANLNKTVAAAMKQIADIETIRDTVGLDALPSSLLETAMLRLENPDDSLNDLGMLHNPPIGRSGVNHRLKSISKIAEECK